MRKNFERTSREAPGDVNDNGLYQIELLDYPKSTFAIINLHLSPPLDVSYGLPRKEYNVTDGEGTNYYYEVVMIHIEDENVKREELENAVGDCWDWFLTHYLL